MAAKNIVQKMDEKLNDLWFISIREVCLRTGYDRSSVERLMSSGKLKFKKFNNGKIGIYKNSFIQFVESGG